MQYKQRFSLIVQAKLVEDGQDIDPDYVLGDLERLQREIEEKKRGQTSINQRQGGGSEADSALSVPPLPPFSTEPTGRSGHKEGDPTITPRLVELDMEGECIARVEMDTEDENTVTDAHCN